MAILVAAILIPAILYPKKWQKVMKKALKEESLVRLSAFVTFIISFLFLSVHWKFNGGWFMIIPIIGWLTLLKGFMLLWFPGSIYKMAKKVYLKSETATTLMAFIGLIVFSIGLPYVALYIY